MRTVLNGLTRGLDLGILDRGLGEQAGARISFYPAAPCLGLVMPSNSPGVNSLWLPGDSAQDPGHPQARPRGALDALAAHPGLHRRRLSGRSVRLLPDRPRRRRGDPALLRPRLVFGDKSTTAQYANNPAIQVHGPGFSKILIGEDQIERWPEFIDLMVASIADNGGRSCINASAVVVPKYAAEIADALAQKLGPVAPLPAQDENARLSAFANPRMAESIDAAIEEGLRTPGAVEVTAKYRNGPRKVTFEGAVYLRPTIVLCDSFAHPLANREFLFPTPASCRCRRPRCSARSAPRWWSPPSPRMPRFATPCSNRR